MRESSAEQRSGKSNDNTEVQFIGNYYGLHDGYDGSVFSWGGCSPALTASIAHGSSPKIIEVFKKVNGEWKKLET